jgi:DHA1 family tetracycline resistance protein-like MFS transporter
VKRSPLLPIFLVVLVDVLGFTIVYPLLPFYAERFGATPLIATTLVSVYALCSLISTPVIGRLSDQFGRRRLLLLSQAGTCAGFIVLGFSEYLWMVFLGRILDGLTAGNLSTAQAYISDHTQPQDRAKAFGMIGIAFGIGFFFGPGMAGVLSGYGLHVPFVVAACLSVGSMICTYTLLEPDSPAARASGKPAGTLTPAVEAGPGGKRPGLFDLATYLDYFRRPGLGSLYLQFFLFSFAFSSFMSGFALFAERRFTTADGHPWTSGAVGYMLA